MQFDQLRRREFVTLLGGAAAAPSLFWPLVARAQQPARMRLVGVLMGIESGRDARARVAAFRRALREAGWMEAKNVWIDVIWGAGDVEHVRADAAELVRKSPDVILANAPCRRWSCRRRRAAFRSGSCRCSCAAAPESCRRVLAAVLKG